MGKNQLVGASTMGDTMVTVMRQEMATEPDKLGVITVDLSTASTCVLLGDPSEMAAYVAVLMTAIARSAVVPDFALMETTDVFYALRDLYNRRAEARS